MLHNPSVHMHIYALFHLIVNSEKTWLHTARINLVHYFCHPPSNKLNLLASTSEIKTIISQVCKCCDVLKSFISKQVLQSVRIWTFTIDKSLSNEFQPTKSPTLHHPQLRSFLLLYFLPILLANRLWRRSQLPRDLRRRSTPARLLRSWVRIPLGALLWVLCVVR